MTASEPRTIGFFFMAGLITLPILFVWFLLLPGFAGSTRVAAFTYAFLPLLLSLAVSGLSTLMG